MSNEDQPVEKQQEEVSVENVDRQPAESSVTVAESKSDNEEEIKKNDEDGKGIEEPKLPDHLTHPQHSPNSPTNPMVLVDSVLGRCVETISGDITKSIIPLEKRIEGVSNNVKKVTEKHKMVLKEFAEFKRKTSDWQNMVKKISKKDLQKIKKLKQLVSDKDGVITSLKSTLDRKDEEIRKQVVSETTPELPQTYDDLHPCLIKRIEFPEESLIYWAVRSQPKRDQDEKSELNVRFIDEEDIYFEDVSDKTGLKLTDEELLKQSKLNLQKAMKACKDSDEKLKSYKTRAHIALKKKNEVLEEIKENLRVREEEVETFQEGRDREDHEREDLQKEVEERTKEVVTLQDDLIALKKERNELETKTRKQKELLETWEEKYRISEQKRERETSQMEDDYQIQMETQKSNWLKRINEKEKIIFELRKSKPNASNTTSSSRPYPIQTNTKNISILDESDEFSSSSSAQSPNMRRISSIEQASTPSKGREDEDDNNNNDNYISDDDDDENKNRKNNKEKKENYKQEFEEIFALAEIQAKREREIKEKNKSIQELKAKLKKYFQLEKEYNKLRKTYQKQAKVLEDVYKKENIPNMEYLKNITIQLLMCDDKPVKKNLLKVVSQMLKFEKHELNKVFNKVINQKSSNSSSSFKIFGF